VPSRGVWRHFSEPLADRLRRRSCAVGLRNAGAFFHSPVKLRHVAHPARVRDRAVGEVLHVSLCTRVGTSQVSLARNLAKNGCAVCSSNLALAPQVPDHNTDAWVRRRGRVLLRNSGARGSEAMRTPPPMVDASQPGVRRLIRRPARVACVPKTLAPGLAVHFDEVHAHLLACEDGGAGLGAESGRGLREGKSLRADLPPRLSAARRRRSVADRSSLLCRADLIAGQPPRAPIDTNRPDIRTAE
jgi:hypothetical protein